MSREKLKKYYWEKYHRINEQGVVERQCTKCNEWLEENLEKLYLKNKKKPELGFASQCKKCQTEYQKKYQKDNWDEQHNRFIKWYEQNKEYNNQWCANWRRENHEHKREYEKNYYLNNPDKFKIYIENHRIHDITKTEEEAMLKVFNYKCAYCGMTLEESKNIFGEKLHNDHVDFNGANDLSNDVPACKSCNSQKRISDMEEWYRKQEFFSEERLEFIKWWITDGYKDIIEDKPPYKIIRKQNEDKRTYHWELWAVDDLRNLIEIIAIEDKKKDLNKHIKNYLEFLK